MMNHCLIREKQNHLQGSEFPGYTDGCETIRPGKHLQLIQERLFKCSEEVREQQMRAALKNTVSFVHVYQGFLMRTKVP